MRVQRFDLLRLSVYALACLGALSLYLAELESVVPYGWLSVASAILAFCYVDRLKHSLLPPLFEQLVTPIVLLWGLVESFYYSLPAAQVLGHLLVMLQMLLFLQQKTLRTYILIAAISLPELAIGAVMNNHFAYGLLVVAYLVLGAICLEQLHFFRTRPPEELARAQRELVSPRLVARLALLGLFTGALGLSIFLVFPRRGQAGFQGLSFQSGRLLTGFSQEVTLGELGTILQSDDEVMTVRLWDDQDHPYDPPDEPLWRGIALVRYHSGRWSNRPIQSRTGRPVPRLQRVPPTRYIRQEIALQPIESDFCFALWPVLGGEARGGGALFWNVGDNALLRDESPEFGTFEYVVISPMGADQGRVSFPVTPREMERLYWNDTLYLDPPLKQELRELISQEIEPVEELEHRPVEERCHRLLAYLSDPNRFSYTLDTTVVDTQVDPVVDFLRNRREGHCEYFASALALMLRAVGVRSRLVNGFKGADVNELMGRFYVVRQLHAHSWVEAAVPDPEVPGTDHRWIVLDPTPNLGRRESMAQVAVPQTAWAALRVAIRQLWNRYILEFDIAEQREYIYGPIQAFAKASLLAVGVYAGRLLRGDQTAWVSTLTAVAALVLTATGAIVLRRARLRRPGGPAGQRRWPWRAWFRRSSLGLYRAYVARWHKLLRQQRIAPLPATTLLETAIQLETRLTQLRAPREVQSLPHKIGLALYELRFRPATSSPPADLPRWFVQLERWLQSASHDGSGRSGPVPPTSLP